MELNFTVHCVSGTLYVLHKMCILHSVFKFVLATKTSFVVCHSLVPRQEPGYEASVSKIREVHIHIQHIVYVNMPPY